MKNKALIAIFAILLVASIVSAGMLIPLNGNAEENSDVIVNELPAIRAEVEYVPNEIIVKFRGDVNPFRVIKVPEGKAEEKIKEYLERRDVIYAEPNYIAYALMVPNDPYYNYQWHLDNPIYGGIQMEEAWGISTGKGVTVAVVDTGIRKGTDLANTCFVSGYDLVNSDTDPTDDNGHGTHVAGTIAQSTNNNLGVAGVAFNSCLMPVKVLNSRGSGTYAQVANGIRYAADNGAKVISLSLGGSSDSATLKDAVAYAYNKGVTLIAAIGNDNAFTAFYPAAYDEYVIAVGATQYDETKAPYSNYGSSLDLVAPGGNNNLDQNKDGYADGVLQQTFTISGSRIAWGYYFFQGTSMATPHVSGVAALLIANGNAITPDEIRTALQETAEDKGAAGRDDIYGWGLVDAFAALNWKAGPDTTPPVISDGKPTGVINDNTPVLNVKTNEKASCKGGIDVDKAYVDMNFTFATDVIGTSHNYEVVTTALTDEIHISYVKCQDEAGNINNVSYSWTFTVDTIAPTQVNGLSVTVVSDSQLDLSWNANTESDLDHYNVYRSTTSGETYNLISSSTTNLYSDTGLAAATIYYYVVSAVDKAENEGVKSTEASGATKEKAAVKCWDASFQYLYRESSQAKKFCKCAQGTYGYNSYNSKRLKVTVYKYVNTGDNENWDATSQISYSPIYQVACTDGVVYLTSRDYYYPK